MYYKLNPLADKTEHSCTANEDKPGQTAHIHRTEYLVNL